MTEITNDIAEKIDFLIKGVEDGKFDEVVKKIEFMKKLSGDHNPPTYLRDLLDKVETLKSDYYLLLDERDRLKSDYDVLKNDYDTFRMHYTNDMTNIVKALAYLFRPDPLNKNYELNEISSFLRNKGINC